VQAASDIYNIRPLQVNQNFEPKISPLNTDIKHMSLLFAILKSGLQAQQK